MMLVKSNWAGRRGGGRGGGVYRGRRGQGRGGLKGLTLGHILGSAGRIHKITTIKDCSACGKSTWNAFCKTARRRLVSSGCGTEAVAA